MHPRAAGFEFYSRRQRAYTHKKQSRELTALSMVEISGIEPLTS